MNQPTNPPAPRRPSPNALLGASATLLAALIVLFASRTGSTARADLVGQAGTLTALTLTGASQDVLVVLDGRAEELMVYRLENQSALELYAKYSVPRMFTDARARTVGQAPGGPAAPATTTPRQGGPR